MEKLNQFLATVAARFVIANDKIAKRISSMIDDGELKVVVRREKQGLRQCINATVFEIRPEKNKPHHMSLEEVWVGYDAEGYHWSDAMRGRLVDCTGLSATKAIDLIVDELKEMIKD